MNFVTKKYIRKTGKLLILSYLLLLIAGIADNHHVDISAGKISFAADASADINASGYLFSDESKCSIHKAFTSVHQVVFYSSLQKLIADRPAIFILQENEKSFSKSFLSNNNLRAPPSA